MNTPQFNVTLQGTSVLDIINGAKNLLSTLEGMPALPAAQTSVAKTAKKKAAPIIEEEQEEMSVDSEESGDGLDFMNDEEPVVESPKKSAKANGAAKLTKDDVNDACLAYAREHDRKATLKVLSKFGVKSINELEEKQYPAVMKALKI